jgi:hypothetical protein
MAWRKTKRYLCKCKLFFRIFLKDPWKSPKMKKFFGEIEEKKLIVNSDVPIPLGT